MRAQFSPDKERTEKRNGLLFWLEKFEQKAQTNGCGIYYTFFFLIFFVG
jgi:hypothetical protein